LIQDYGFRLYNPALGKFLSVDPLSPDFPWYTPYQFAGNKPIWAIDLDGLEETLATMAQQKAQESYLKNEISANELQDVYEAQALGAAAGGLIVGAWWTAGTAAWWAIKNPFTIIEGGTFGGQIVYGALDESGAAEIPVSPFDNIGRALVRGGKSIFASVNKIRGGFLEKTGISDKVVSYVTSKANRLGFDSGNRPLFWSGMFVPQVEAYAEDYGYTIMELTKGGSYINNTKWWRLGVSPSGNNKVWTFASKAMGKSVTKPTKPTFLQGPNFGWQGPGNSSWERDEIPELIKNGYNIKLDIEVKILPEDYHIKPK
jgi:hypothetical protein